MKFFRFLRAGVLVLLGFVTQVCGVYVVFTVFEDHSELALLVWVLLSIGCLVLAVKLRQTKNPLRWYFFSIFFSLLLAPVVMFLVGPHPSDQWVEDNQRIEGLADRLEEQGVPEEEKRQIISEEFKKNAAEREARGYKNPYREKQDKPVDSTESEIRIG